MSDQDYNQPPVFDAPAIDHSGSISDRARDLQDEMARRDEVESPPRHMIELTRQYYVGQRERLLQQVAEIEAFLGFVEVSDNLSVRIAKIELFLGVKA